MRNINMKTRIISLMCCVLFLLPITSCSFVGLTRAGASKATILEDLKQSSYIQEKFVDYEVKAFEIVKRKTDDAQGEDCIYLTAEVYSKDSTREGYIDLILDYKKYNEGWFLEDCRKDETGPNGGAKFRAVSYPEHTEGEIDRLILYSGVYPKNGPEDVKWEYVFSDDGQDAYLSITYVARHKYETDNCTLKLGYKVSDDGYWNVTTENYYCNENWFLKGSYLSHYNISIPYNDPLESANCHQATKVIHSSGQTYIGQPFSNSKLYYNGASNEYGAQNMNEFVSQAFYKDCSSSQLDKVRYYWGQYKIILRAGLNRFDLSEFEYCLQDGSTYNKRYLFIGKDAVFFLLSSYYIDEINAIDHTFIYDGYLCVPASN